MFVSSGRHGEKVIKKEKTKTGGNDMNNDYKRLMRSRTNRTICGVCGGIGEYLNVDPTVIRILWVFCAFALGSGILAYIIAAIIMPEE